MPNKQLTASVRLNTRQFEQKLKRIARGIDAINNSVGKQSNAYQSVNNALGETDKIADRVKRKINETTKSTNNWVSALNSATGKLTKCKSIVGTLSSKMGKLAGLLLGGLSVGTAIQGADTLTGAQNRFNNIASQQLGDNAYTKDSSGKVTGYSDKALGFTQTTMDKIYASAQKTRVEYADMLSNVSKTMTLAPDAFGGNIDNAIRFQEIMAEAYAVGGASAAEMSTSMYQLTQALGSGTLAGDELRSVREGAPLAYQQIEKFAQGVLRSEESLKDLASQGKITSEIVVAAIMSAGDEMDQAFALTKFRFTDVFNQIKSAAQKTFSPVVEMLTEKLNEAVDNGLVEKFETLFTNIAKAVMIAFNYVERFATAVANNWYWIQDLIIAGLIAIGVYEAALIASRIVHAITDIALWIAQASAATKYLIIIGIIAIAIYLVSQVWTDFANGVITLGQAIIRVLLIIGIAGVLIALVLGLWMPALIIAGITALLVVIFKFFGYVCGGVAWLVATIWNIVVGIVNGIIQFLWTRFVEPWIGIIEWVLNVFNGGFNSFGDAVKNLLGNIISWFLSLGKVVTKIIDAIFGTNWTDGLSALQDKVLGWGKNENSITLSREAPEVLQRVSATDAYNNAFDWGSNLMNFQNEASEKEKTSALDEIGNKLGLTDVFNKMNNLGSGDSLSYDNPEKLLGNISDNTDDISSSLDLTKEDLEYLRRVADMEWKKEYTTASIKVEMTNNNTVDGKYDLSKLAIDLRDMIEEEMYAVADGVYS